MMASLAIVSHDAGGAEILSSWIRQNPHSYYLAVEGPAIAIFERKLGKLNTHSLSDAIELCDWVLCGTSWQSNLEKQAIVQAKTAGKKVIAFLDHWVNYSERFQLDDVTVLPDEIWVGDTKAKMLAKKKFPDIKIVLKPNPYFKDLRIELCEVQKISSDTKKHSILYVCEPIREHAMLAHADERYWGYTEEDALLFFLKNIDALGVVKEIKIRPHPSESKNKYDWTRRLNPLVMETFGNQSLLRQIADADIVVGCESMAMVIALLAKKRVVSSIPPGGRICALPQNEVEHLQDLVRKIRDA